MAASTSAAAPPPPPIGRLDGGGGGSAAAAGGNGNGALYHVAAVDQGLHLEPETLSYWGYDDGTSTLLVAKGGLVFAYDLSPGVAPGSQEQLRWTFPLADGPPVRALRLSLDGGLLAIQRSPVMLEFVELATGNVFVQGTDRGRGEVLCFFFTELEGADLVMVTPGGMELLEFVPRRQGLRLRERVRLPVEWALYTHETRMVLLGTAAGGSSYIKAFQFVSSGLVALPPFTAGAAASAIALMGPAAGGAALVAGSPAAAAAVATPPARVTADCLRLIKVYGRVYCAHINRRSLKLELYRFYTDTVVLQHTYELFSPHVELAVVDSVIVAQCCTAGGGGGAAADGAAAAAAGVAMLFDVAAPTLQPIANPLPLRTLRHGGAPPEAASEPDASADAADAAAGGGGGCKPRWEYLAPNLVLDRGSQTAYRLALNLPAVAESCSEPAVLVGFLQRRRGPTPSLPLPQGAAAAAAAAAALQHPPQRQPPSPKALLMSVVRNALQERMPLPTIRAIFEDLCAGYAAALDRELAALAAAAAAPPPPAQPPAAPARGASGAAAGAAAAAAAAPPPPLPPTAVPMPQYVTAEEVASELFRWLHDEEVVDAPYLQAALWEYMSAAFAAGIPLPPYLQELSVEVLLQQSQEGQVLQLLYSQVDYVGNELAERILAAAPKLTTTTSATTTQQQQQQQQQLGGEADADAHGGGGGGGGAPAGALSSQLGLDVLARAALPARYEPVAGAAAGGAGAGVGGGSGDAAAYVEALLAAGEVLRAARVMRRYRVSRPSVKEFIAAVGARGDEAALAAVYRTFQDELLASYPKYELAARKLLPGGGAAAAPAPAPAAAAVSAA
ncbi:hypothetical protein PLESTB_000856200 [Pleodorina starrii]|uniref:Regulator of MON1-CCZ1 complex N-terminal domain-containing protein n=1 Tax=Pleodorina starrii TaxID=330485 RepID=A0A9W6BN23_9CHLO|nr:hypothetical protein PLESTM_001437600 [Pleodorina starrii]GLC54366.1 hypothetical protein PLESTB_000856200 [Pleodorina starrii]GLC72017.1 hypothetical protein PLESTF_001195400 [Pleodorina starrii]